MNITTNPTSRHTARRAFTLIEILVVVVIIALLVGLLLHAVSRSMRIAKIDSMKLNFQAIATALNNYKADFRDYPKNGFAMSDIPSSAYPSADPYCPDQARTDPSLAMALIGPGPAGLANNAGNYLLYKNGDSDGADGPGFRSRLAVYQATTLNSNVAVGATTLSITLPVAVAPPNQTPPPPVPFTVISIGGPGSPDGSIPVKSWSGTTTLTITLSIPIQGAIIPPATAPQGYPQGTAISLLVPAGRTWGPYLPPEKFAISYFQVPLSSQNGTPPYEPLALPVLLDNWGNPILYYPAYNAYINHVDTTTMSKNNGAFQPAIPAGSTVSIGPLFGTPSTSETTAPPGYSYNTAVNATKNTGPSVFWTGPLSYLATGQVAAILYRLGDVYGFNAIVSAPAASGYQPEIFNLDQPFFLISAGPDGQFTDLYAPEPTPALTSPPGTPQALQAAWKTIMKNSDDVYSFEP